MAARVPLASPAAALAAALIAASGCADARRLEDAVAPCARCHGAPPATGAHLVHASSPWTAAYGALHVLEDVAPGGGPSYEFGCGNCHPLDVADHWAHVSAPVGGVRMPDVVLDPTGISTARLRGRNAPTAAYDPATGTCTGVYCHSSGQETPAYVESPRWTATPGSLGCDGCHGNPPQYPSGGAGAADANSHVNLDLELGEPAWEFGHFAGLPGPDHTSKHGDPEVWGTTTTSKASPITCQACHYETVDPENVRTTGGFFYFDASGDYDLRPDGYGDRALDPSWQAMQCVTCHADHLGRGSVLPLRHVNGRRDVTFDPRTALPPGYPTGLPPLVTSDPIRPYYLTLDITSFDLAPETCATTWVPSCDVKADVEVRAAVGGGRVLTFTLEHAQYDPATKTCSSVACHLDRQLQVDTFGENPVMGPLRWGAPYLYMDTQTCNGCHPR
jgi:predicted CxxxxCH...CXXCH cytochrome family protein